MCSRTTDLYKLTTIALLLRLNSKAIVQSVRPCLCVRGSSYRPTAAPAVSFTGGWQVVFVLDGRVGVTPLDVEIARWLHRQSYAVEELCGLCAAHVGMHCCAMQCRQRLRVIPVASKCEVNSAALDFVGSISADFDALGFGEVRRNAKGVLTLDIQSALQQHGPLQFWLTQ